MKWQLQSSEEWSSSPSKAEAPASPPAAVQPPGASRRTSEDAQKWERKASGGKQQQQQQSLEIAVLSDRFENKHEKEMKKKKDQGKKYLLKMKHLKVVLWGWRKIFEAASILRKAAS